MNGLRAYVAPAAAGFWMHLPTIAQSMQGKDVSLALLIGYDAERNPAQFADVPPPLPIPYPEASDSFRIFPKIERKAEGCG